MLPITTIGGKAFEAAMRARHDRRQRAALDEDAKGETHAAHAAGGGQQTDRFTDQEHKHHVDVAHHWTGGDDFMKAIALKAWNHVHNKHGASAVRKMKSYQAAVKHFKDHPPGAHPHNVPKREDSASSPAPGIAAMDLIAGDMGMHLDGN
jgi:hypothetical protein